MERFLQARCPSFVQSTVSVKNWETEDVRTIEANGTSHFNIIHSFIQNCMFVLLVFNITFSTNRLYCVIGIWNIYCVGPGGTHRNRQTKRKKNTHKHFLPPGLCGGNPLTTLRCPQRGLFQPITWQVLTIKPKQPNTSTYSRIQQQTKNPYYATKHNESICTRKC